MPRMTPNELCIANIRGDFPSSSIGYQSAEEALAELKQRTGIDFGLDANKWQSWLDANPEVIAPKVTNVRDALKAASFMKQKQ
jgi:hypothetical protein